MPQLYISPPQIRDQNLASLIATPCADPAIAPETLGPSAVMFCGLCPRFPALLNALQIQGFRVGPALWTLPTPILHSIPSHCSLVKTRAWIWRLSPKDLGLQHFIVGYLERVFIYPGPKPLVHNSEIPKALKMKGFYIIHVGTNQPWTAVGLEMVLIHPAKSEWSWCHRRTNWQHT